MSALRVADAAHAAQVVDLQQQTVRELNAAVHRPGIDNTSWEVLNPRGRHNLAVGIAVHLDISIAGDVGYYCAGMNQLANVQVLGRCGPGVAENMMSGRVEVHGEASQAAGASARGGLLAVRGDAGARCGISLKGADIVVTGSVGHAAGFMGQRGRIVVCGDAGEALGDSLYEAELWVAGSVASLGADCVQREPTEDQLAGLAALLYETGVDAPPTSFKHYGSARELYHFKSTSSGAYG